MVGPTRMFLTFLAGWSNSPNTENRNYVGSKSGPILSFIEDHRWYTLLWLARLATTTASGRLQEVRHELHLPHEPPRICLFLFLLWQHLWARLRGRFVFSYYSDPLPTFSWETQVRNGERWSCTAHNSARTESSFKGEGKGMSSAAKLLSLPKFKGFFSNNRDITVS